MFYYSFLTKAALQLKSLSTAQYHSGPWEVRPLSKHFEQRFNPVPLWTHLCNLIYSWVVHSGLLGYKYKYQSVSVCVCVQVISPKLLILFRWNVVCETFGYPSSAFWGLDSRGEITYPKWGGNFYFSLFLFGSYLMKSWSDFNERWYVRFSGNLVLYYAGLNPMGKFLDHLGEGEIFKILDFW